MKLIWLHEGRFKSPFTMIIALGYYDGATSGIAFNNADSEAYRFEKLAWDSGQDTRIYSFARLPDKVYKEIFSLLLNDSQITPTFPMWIPSQIEANQKGRLEALLNKADKPEIVLASRNLLKSILGAKKVSPFEFERVKDWFEFLELNRAKRKEPVGV
jgi:hypothetical protein